MRKMRVLMVNYEFPPIGGGAGNAHLCLLKEYAGKEGLTVDVLTSAAAPGFYKEKFADNITIYKVGLHKKALHYWRKIEVIEWLIKAKRHYRRLLRKNDYDLAHAFFGFPTGWLCYRSAGKLPYIISLRGSDVPGGNSRLSIDYKLLGPMFKGIWKRACLLVACSGGLRQRALRFLPSVDIDVIGNGVDVDRFFPAGLNRGHGTLKLLAVGRLSSTKRVEMLIGAAELLNRSGMNVQLSIAGGGAMEGVLRQMVVGRRLGQVVHILGRVGAGQMPELYRSSDIFVSASMQEGMSNAMLEAMASGLPIITTRCEGVDELIKDNGIVVENACGSAIADAVAGLTNNPAAYRWMSLSARKWAEKFSWAGVAREYLLRYERIRNGFLGR